MAEENIPNFLGMSDTVRTRKYNNLYNSLASQTVGDRSFADMYRALQEAEVGAYKEKTGWPYIFTGASRKSSAFGPLQITYSTALDYFYPGNTETEQRENMNVGNFKEGYTQLPDDVKSYIKGFIEQGINKRNNKGGVYGGFGVGDISVEDHRKHYPFLAAVHVNEKKKISDTDTVASFVNAHFGDIQEDDPQKENKQEQLNNLQTKVNKSLGLIVSPATGEEEGMSPPQPIPVPETDNVFLEQEGPLPDVGEDAGRPDLQPLDVAPETPDAIPPSIVDVPEDKSVFERAYDYLFRKDDTPEEVQQREQTKQRLLQSLEMNEGGIATAIQESRDIETGADTRTKQEMLSDQMAGLGVVGKTAVESVPGVGEAIVAQEIAKDISAGEYLSAGLGTAALGVGVLPAGDILNKPLRAAAKKLRKKDADVANNMLKDTDSLETWKKQNPNPKPQKQNPNIEKAANDLLEGKITGKQYRSVVKENMPIVKIDEVPEVPSFTEIVGALDKDKSAKGIIGLNKTVKDGTRVASRLDIPAYERFDKWVVSVHDAFDKKGRESLNGDIIGYGKTAVLKNVEFKGSPTGAASISARKTNKSTIARIFGDYVNAEPENVEEYARQVIKDKSWTQVGYNPFRHGFFYDKDTSMPIKSADEVIQVGPLVLAKNAQKIKISEAKQVGPKGGLKIRTGKPIEGLKNLKETKTVFNEGGTVMERQMEMFEDGGLMDEGGTIDPESGNEVPPGSTQEEVRDDIPAQLSEGEFVFPADVVRFIGLEKLMQMRQEAKAGLARMEAMGQMGNSEEAVLPDDIPFDLDDIDMEDEPMEFQQGGLVPNPYGVYQQPSQFATYGQQMYQAPQIPTIPTPPQVPLQTGFQPVTTPVQTASVPTFEQIMPTTTGQYDELREYINEETGQTMTIPFINGEPIYPIPQGFVPKPTEEVVASIPKTTTVPTSRVREDDPSDEPETIGGGTSIAFGGSLNNKGRVDGAYLGNITFTGLSAGESLSRIGKGFTQIGSKDNITPPLPEGATAIISNLQLPKDPGDVRPAEVMRARLQIDSDFFNRTIANTNVTDRSDLAKTVDYIRGKYKEPFLNDSDNIINAEQEFRQMERDERDAAARQRLAEARDDDSKFDAIIADAIRSATEEVERDYDDEAFSPVSVSQAELESARQSAPTISEARERDREESDRQDPRGESAFGGGFRAEGGLIDKPKPKAKKKMKRGGIASKK